MIISYLILSRETFSGASIGSITDLTGLFNDYNFICGIFCLCYEKIIFLYWYENLNVTENWL